MTDDDRTGPPRQRRTRRRDATLHGDHVAFWDSAPAEGAATDPDDELVLLIHGIAGSAHTWSPLLSEVARHRDRRRWVAPDLLGHGSSSAPWADYSLGGYATGLRDLLVSLGYERATIVGHSLGGGVAQQFAFQFPQHTARLVLIDSGGLGREVSPALRAATLPAAEWVLPVIAGTGVVRAARQIASAAGRLSRRVSPSTWESGRAFASLADPTHRRAFVHTARSVIDRGGQRVRATSRLDLAADLPLLVAWGTADSMIPLEHGLRAHELVPGSELALFEGAGHFPHCDQPQAFADRLLRFLDEHPPAALDPADFADRIAGHSDLR
ncbi:alpha/beta fold hydrolase [Actinomycetospora cinnamomea]|uniref:Pimeloyl-ACP methyl ester carboxylesterase n=1 Tax=Actinomycetospora cinnamomea TaxID=663609 RepID=A0A2U1EXE4_9PSEU|nr:alpha/beta hydrolase [Actinomycetospora cinnamomea]PVZ04623.1 pimeloyl-ACP methyl ester carboxylesterase [Actinomycetospora cinnamomea]